MKTITGKLMTSERIEREFRKAPTYRDLDSFVKGNLTELQSKVDDLHDTCVRLEQRLSKVEQSIG